MRVPSRRSKSATEEWPAPKVGEHTEQILREAGYVDAEVQNLSQLGVVVPPPA